MRRRHTIPLLLTAVALVAAGCLPGANATTTESVAGASAKTTTPADRVVLPAKADAWTSREMPTNKAGTEWVLRALSGSRLRRSWVRFDMPAAPVAGATVASAQLTIPVKLGSGSVKVEIAKSSAWSESTLSWSNEPQLDRWVGRGTSSNGKIVVDLVNAVWPSLPATFAISSVDTDKELVLHSRESGNGPTLTVRWNLPTTSQSSPATAAPTTTTTAPAPAPAPATRSVPFGMNVRWESGSTWPQLFAKAQSTFGTFDIVRIFHPGLPKDWGSFYGSIPQPQLTSFKMPPAEVLAGKHDAYLRNWFATAPRDRVTYWSFHPEPEDDIMKGDYTPAQFREAHRRIDRLADEARNPNLRTTLVLMYWTANPASGRKIDDYYPGGDATDVIAFDTYNWAAPKGGYPSGSEMFDSQLAVGAAKGKPVGFGELGSQLAPGDDGRGRAAWLKEMGAYLQRKQVEFVLYWNDITGDFDTRLQDKPSIDAWREVMAG